MANELIAEAITDYFGGRCLDYAEGCPTCEAWAEYDRMNTRPAAPVEGLENVAWRHPSAHWAHKEYDAIVHHCLNDGPKPEPLVTRSQAEAIIAARDAEIERLQKINALVMGDDEDKPRYTTKRLKHEIARATEALETQLASAKKVLTDIQCIDWDGLSVSDVFDEINEIVARAALEDRP